MKLASVRVELQRCSKHLFQDRNAAAVLNAARPLLMAYFLADWCSLSSAKAAQVCKQDPRLAGLQRGCTASKNGHDLAGEDLLNPDIEGCSA